MFASFCRRSFCSSCRFAHSLAWLNLISMHENTQFFSVALWPMTFRCGLFSCWLLLLLVYGRDYLYALLLPTALRFVISLCVALLCFAPFIINQLHSQCSIRRFGLGLKRSICAKITYARYGCREIMACDFISFIS